jgi:hypothetical protein
MAGLRVAEPAQDAAEDWDALMAESLIMLRKLSHCPDLPVPSRCAADLLAQTVERLSRRPGLRVHNAGEGES